VALEDVLKNDMLDIIDTSVTHLGLHDVFPATSGNEISGGSYARQVVAFDAASGGSIDVTGTPVFDVPSGESVTAVGLWDAISAGAIQGGADVTLETWGADGTYTLTSLTISIT